MNLNMYILSNWKSEYFTWSFPTNIFFNHHSQSQRGMLTLDHSFVVITLNAKRMSQNHNLCSY